MNSIAAIVPSIYCVRFSCVASVSASNRVYERGQLFRDATLRVDDVCDLLLLCMHVIDIGGETTKDKLTFIIWLGCFCFSLPVLFTPSLSLSLSLSTLLGKKHMRPN